MKTLHAITPPYEDLFAYLRHLYPGPGIAEWWVDDRGMVRYRAGRLEYDYMPATEVERQASRWTNAGRPRLEQ